MYIWVVAVQDEGAGLHHGATGVPSCTAAAPALSARARRPLPPLAQHLCAQAPKSLHNRPADPFGAAGDQDFFPCEAEERCSGGADVRRAACYRRCSPSSLSHCNISVIENLSEG